MEKELIINVGRQIGSGGHIIAKMLADEFGCQYYDREILNIAAKESGFSEKFFEQNDEQKGFMKGHFHIHLPLLGDNDFYKSNFSQESLISVPKRCYSGDGKAEPTVCICRKNCRLCLT